MRGREEVEVNARREDFGRKRVVQDGGEERGECSESCVVRAGLAFSSALHRSLPSSYHIQFHRSIASRDGYRCSRRSLFPSLRIRSSGGLWLSFRGSPSKPSISRRGCDGEKYVVGNGAGDGGSQGSFRMPWRGWARVRHREVVKRRPITDCGR